jgi:hypothetical protein
MVNDLPVAEPVSTARAANPYRRVATAQGLYFLVTGIWPLIHIDSFQAVTGPKFDLWLVYTVGVLVAVIGLTLLVAARNGRVGTEVLTLAVGSAVGLMAIDLVFVARGVLQWVYLADAAAEVLLIGWWAVAHFARPPRPPAAVPQYPHLQALLSRGQSVSPNGNGSGR